MEKPKKFHQLAGWMAAGLAAMLLSSIAPPGECGPTRVRGFISEDAVWSQEQGPYIVESTVTIPVGRVLTIQRGTVVKFALGAGMVVEGELNGAGTADSPVVFTSLQDDSVAGDTNGDGGASQPKPGGWNDVYFAPRSRGRLEHCIFKYGGSGSQLAGTSHFALGSVTCENSSPALSNCEFTDSATNGFYALTASPVLTGCSFRRNGRHGVMLDNSASAVENCRFADNAEYGLWLDDVSAASGGKVLGCSFSGNKAGVSASPSAVVLAQNSSFDGNREGAVHVREGILNLSSVWRRLGEPYMVTGTVVVDGKAELSVEPGTVVKLTSGAGIVVNGSLRLESSSDNPIVFTSFKDDEYGGDTNADGNASLPGPGNWDGIVFAPSGSGVLSGCLVRYGGAARQVAEGLFTYGAVSVYSDAVTLEDVEFYGNRTGIYCRGASPRISNCRVLDSKDAGIQCAEGASPAISGCTIRGVYQNPNYGIAADAKSLLSTSAGPLISRNTLSGNKWAFSLSPAATANLSGDNRVFGNVSGAVLLSKGEITGPVVWPAFEGAYGLAGPVTVAASGSLSILPGVVVKGQQDAGIVVAGKIEAVGLPEARIVFTSFKDDSVAGDSNGDRNTTVPQAGDWIGIVLDGGRGAFEFCDFRYAGQLVGSARPQAGLYCKGTSPSVKSCVFDGNAGYGLYGDDTSFRQSAAVPLIQGCLFRGNDWGLHLHSESTVNLASDNTAVQNKIGACEITGKALSGRASWPGFEGAYVVSDSLTIASGAELVLNAGCVLKMMPNTGITVNGILRAEGRPTARIVVTTVRDDTVAGDTNMDGGATKPSGSDWLDIYFAPGSGGRLAFTDLRYGGRYANTSLGMLTIVGSSPELEYVSVFGGFYNGIYMSDAKPAARNLTVVNNIGSGIYLTSGAAPSIRNSIISFNGAYGIYSERPSAASVSYSCLFGNNSGAFQNVKPGEGMLISDPGLVDLNKGDLRLKTGSPAVDAGDPSDYDPWSTSRADLGAFPNVTPDLTPPSIPEVRVPAPYTDRTDAITASWQAYDPESGISLFRYAVGTKPGAADIVPWKEAGKATEVTITGLALRYGGTYFVSVQAVNGAGAPSAVGYSAGVTVLKRGDLNGDGAISPADVSAAIAIALGLRPPLPRELFAGDVAPVPGYGGAPFGDGRVTVGDALRILKKAAGLEGDPWP